MKLVIRAGRKDVFKLELSESVQQEFEKLNKDLKSEVINPKQYKLKVLSTILRSEAE